jgi:hypothetical protein
MLTSSELQRIYEDAREAVTHGTLHDDHVAGLRAVAAAALAAAPQGEPVAWMDVDERGNRHGLRYWSEGGREEVPLYVASPAPVAQPSAEPTTECTTCGATVVRVTGVYDYPPPGEELVRAARVVVEEWHDPEVLGEMGDAIDALRRALEAGDGAGEARDSYVLQLLLEAGHVTPDQVILARATARWAMGDAPEAKGGGR